VIFVVLTTSRYHWTQAVHNFECSYGGTRNGGTVCLRCSYDI